MAQIFAREMITVTSWKSVQKSRFISDLLWHTNSVEYSRIKFTFVKIFTNVDETKKNINLILWHKLSVTQTGIKFE